MPKTAGRPVKNIWTKEMLALLGQISDMDFADQYNLTASAVKKKRSELKIPGYKHKPIAWGKYADLFMVASDEQIAKGLDMHPATIRRKRVSLIQLGYLDEVFLDVKLSNKTAEPRIKEMKEYILRNEGKLPLKKPAFKRKMVRRRSRARYPGRTFPKELAVAKVKRYPHTALFLSNRSKKPLQEFCEQMAGYFPSSAGFDASLKTLRAWGYDVEERWEILRHFVQQGIDTDKALQHYSTN